MEPVRVYALAEVAELLAPDVIRYKSRWLRQRLRASGVVMPRSRCWFTARDVDAVREVLYPPVVTGVADEPASPVPVEPDPAADRVVSLADSLAAGSQRRRMR